MGQDNQVWSRNIFSDESYWQLISDSLNNNEEVRVIVLPKENPQFSITYLNLEAKGIKNAILEFNSEEDVFSEIVRKQHPEGSKNITIASEVDAMEVCMMIGERLTFQTDDGFFELEIMHIANPGNWREPYSKAEDITALEIKFEKNKIGLKGMMQ